MAFDTDKTNGFNGIESQECSRENVTENANFTEEGSQSPVVIITQNNVRSRNRRVKPLRNLYKLITTACKGRSTSDGTTVRDDDTYCSIFRSKKMVLNTLWMSAIS